MNANYSSTIMQNDCASSENEKPVKKMRLVMITGEPSFKMLIRRNVKELLIDIDDVNNS